MRNGSRLFGGLVVAVSLWGLGAQDVRAQAPDMTGTWTLTVESQNGVTTPTLTLTQDGMTLTGHYSSETLGEADVTGTVEGRRVTVEFTATIEGLGEAPLTYSGDVNDEGVWSGSLDADFQGQAFPLGTFTATKS
jgi:hypothetical protein